MNEPDLTPEQAWAVARRVVNMAYIADELGMTRAAVSAWTKVPAERVVVVSRLTGIARQKLRPDLYTSDDPWSAL